MKMLELLDALRGAGVVLSLEAGRLKTAAPKGAITPALAEGIRTHRDALVDFLARARVAGAPEPACIPRAVEAALHPLSFAQQRLWFIDRLEGGSSQYNLPAALELKGRFEPDALQHALDALVERHAILRTGYEEHEGVPMQRVHPAGRVPLHRLDLRDLAGPEREDALRARMEADAGRPFDLGGDLMLRCTLVAMAEAKHVLLFTMHHIASDGWSMGILVREMAALYAGFAQGQAVALAPLRIQYADFASWQRQHAALDAQLDYWRTRLDGAPTLLELPTDRPRPPVQSHAGGVLPFHLQPALCEALHALSRRHGTSLFMTLLAGWSALLSRLSGQDEVVVGTPVANRQRTEVEPLIGFFVNTLALRVGFDASTTVASLLDQVREHTLEAYAHQDVPFEQVVEAVQPVRSLAHSPLCQAVLSFNNTPDSGRLELPGLTLEAIPPEHQSTHFDLTLALREGEDGIAGGLEFARDLFDEATLRHWLAGFASLLEAMALADPATPVARLPLLDAAQRQHLLHGVHGASQPLPHASVQAAFEARTDATPDALALTGEGRQWTFDALDRAANRLAHGLREAGVGADVRVAICAPRSAGFVVAMLAVLKAGAAYVPLEVDAPAARLAQLVEDAGARVVLAPDALRAGLREAGVAQPMLWHADTAGQPDSRPTGVATRAGDLAYVIYTSGSTGTPKGVMVEHRSVLRLALAPEVAVLGAGDCVAHCANPAFDASTWEVWAPLLSGARVAVIDRETVLSPTALATALVEARVTALWLTVGLFNEYVDRLGDAFAGLSHLLVGGDALDPRSVARLLDGGRAPARVVNGYGPTETTTFAVVHEITRSDASGRSIPIGRPIANTRVYVLDGEGQPVPVGVSGELHIGGAGVARGYLGREALTAERFVADPFAGEAGARMYRTGDLVRWRADGTLEYLGRNDQQVKIRGFRVELGEIESALSSRPGVRGAVVVVHADPALGKRLVAYVASDASGADALRRDLSERLPAYMVPSSIMVLPALPLTANGKVDRQRLPAPEAAVAAVHEAPQTPTEQAIAAIWTRLLGVEQPGRGDDFFALGGHSLLATRVASEIASGLGRRLGIRALFEHTTLAALAAHIDAQDPDRYEAIPVAPRDAVLPLSFAQQRLWFIDQLDRSAGSAYHIPSAMRLDGPLDARALQAALDGIVARHEVLRTTFAPVEGGACQVIASASTPFDLAHHDLSHLDDDARDEAVARHAAAEERAPFDLEQGPLIRGRLLRLADEAHVLLVTQHHIVSDGWSIGVLTRELVELYDAVLEERAHRLPALPVQYADYAVWQRAHRSLESQVAYWRQALEGAPALLELPADHARPSRQSHAGGILPVSLPPALCEALHSLSRVHGTTLFMTLLAGWSALLSRLSGQDEVVVGTPVANRQRTEVEPLIGFFVNTLALRVGFDASTTVASLLDQVREHTLEAYAHQDVPFEQVVEAVQPVRSLAHSPVFQAVFALNNTARELDAGARDLTVSALPPPHVTTQFDLTLSLSEDADGIRGIVEYASDLFEPATVQGWIDAYARLLGGMVADPATPVARLPLLDAAQRQHLLHGVHGASQPLPHASVQAAFEARVDATPDALALTGEGRQWTFDALDRAANRLAHGLREAGVGADVRVAICAPRSAGFVVAMLAVLKAGAAYVPLEVDAPAARLAQLVEDAGARVVLAPDALRAGLREAGVAQPMLWHADTAGQPDSRPTGVATRAGDLAYVIYTSGSTGTPKGVMVEHRSVLRLALAPEVAVLGAGDCVAHCANPAFDASTWEVWAPLLSGARVAVIDSETVLSPTALATALVEARVTALWLTVGLFNEYVDRLGDAFAGLSHLLVGGDALDPRSVARLLDGGRAPARVVNGYGPTETTTFAVVHEITRSDASGRSIPIGRPIANTRVYVLDGEGQPVPVGVSGELHIGGAGVARGYLGREALTAERFVADPFAGEAGARMYRTGDLVRWRADGMLEYLGRNDQQVKIRGFRVELGEIEQVLSSRPGVRQVLVVAHRSDEAPTRLVAYVAVDGGPGDATEVQAALRRDLSERLPAYMVPSSIMVLPALPLTANGKVDRQRLPAPVYRAAEGGVAPRDATEATLAEVWCSVLRLESVGVHDNFFEIGGDSILSIQVVARANQAGLAISTRQLFEAQTIAELARVAQGATGVQAPQEDIEGAMPLLPIQRAFLEDGDVDRHHFNQSVLLETPAGFELSRLRALVAALYARHDALRLQFEATASGWRAAHAARTAEMVAASCVHERLPGPVSSSAAFIAERCTHWQSAFDLASGPLLRAVWFEGTSPDEGRLLLAVHHAVVDGVSWRILLADLERAHAQQEAGEAIALPAKTSSFRQWGEALAGYAQSPALAAEGAYWQAQAGHAVPALPVDHRGDDFGTLAGTRTVALSLDEASTQALLAQCNAAYRTRVDELLLAGLYLGLRRWSGAQAIRLRLEGHGRESLFEGLDVTGTVGWFTTVYPLTLDTASASVDEVVKAVKEQVRAVPGRGVGYGVLRYLSPDASVRAALSAMPEPELEFNYLGQFDQVLNAQTRFQAASEHGGAQGSPRRRRSSRIGVSAMVYGGCLQLSLTYPGAQYEAATMEALAAQVEQGLGEVIAHCRTPGVGAFTPSDFPLARVDAPRLAAWQARYPALARLYPATPMQAGLHYHGLLDRSAYVVQVYPVLAGSLDPVRFRAAWDAVVARHDILRTAFVGEEDGLHQLVQSHAPLAWHEEDLRGLSAQAQSERFEAYRMADKQAGFDFERAPLMRVALFRLDEARWRLLWTQHHILLDGWCLPLVYRDVMRLYYASMEGREAALPAPVPYERYIGWLQSREEAQARAHWRAVLGDVEAPTPLAIDRLGGDGEGYREQVLVLGAGPTQALQALAKSRHTTVNTLVQWAWGYVLHRYSGEGSVVFGATISGRTAPVAGIEEMVGLFINTIPVRVDYAASEPLEAGIARLHREFQQGNEHGYLSLPEIQRQSGVAPGTALFDSILAFENYPLDAADEVSAMEGDARIRLESPGNDEQTSYRLSISVSVGETLQARMGYRREHFRGDMIERLQAHLARVLEQLPAAATAADIEFLSESERQLPTHAEIGARASAACAHQLFEAHAARSPGAPALWTREGVLAYGELDRRANQVAHALRQAGVRTGDVVGLCMQRSSWLPVSLLGILKAGAAYLPLDPAYPEERLRDMVDDAGLAHAILDPASLAAFPWLDAIRRLPADPAELQVALEGHAATALDPGMLGLAPDSLAYMVYTSGSTGRPKGVLLEHRGLVNLADNQQRLYGTTPESRVLGFASLSFDAAAWEWLMAFSSGACLYLADEEDRHSVDRLSALMVEQAVTHATLPPALLAHMPLERDYALQALILAGEACDERLAWRWARRYRTHNAYGPSENTVCATSAPIEPGRAIVLGEALHGVEVHLLDAAGRAVPVGIPGELHLGGIGLARGYHRRPDLTAERFIECARRPGTRLYRTGDLACRRPDGGLLFLGRLDAQVKIRGFRVEPGEIEQVLASRPGVRQALVVAHRSDEAPTRLVAYVAVDGGPGDATEVQAALRRDLSERLPAYMVPSSIMVLPALPLTANGKVDRQRLPAPVYRAAEGGVAPRDATEATLAEVWCSVLRLESVGVHDNFFEIGGDSILSIQVVARANQAGLAISTRQLFEAQTIAELARVAQGATGVQAPQEDIEGAMPLLPIQRAFLEDGDVDRHHFNQSVLLETPAGFELSRLRALVAALYARHDALRLRFEATASGWRAAHAARTAEMVAASCVHERLPGPVSSSAAFIAERCTHWQSAFDLASGPLLRAVWFEGTSPDEGRLLLAVHHAVVDGVSWRILLADLERAHAQQEAGEAIALPAKTSSFRQWGEALAGYAQSPALAAEGAYWQAQAGHAVPALPVDHRGDDFGTLAGTRTVALSLDEASTQALLAQCNAAYRTRVDELLLAGLYLGLRRWSGAQAIRLRLEGHGRESLFEALDVTGTVGWFTTVYPLTLDTASASVDEVVKAVKEQVRAVPGRGVGYGVLRYLSPDASVRAALSAMPEPELEFNYLGQFDQVLNAQTRFQAASEYGGAQGSPRRRRSSRIGVSAMVYGGCLQLSLTYPGAQYEAATMEALAAQVEQGLGEVIAHCRTPGVGAFTPSDFPLARVDAPRLAAWQARYPALARLYPATPMQAGLHYHGLLDRSAYVVQVYPVLAGSLDPVRFRAAWDAVVARHDILRTAFVGEEDGLHQLVQSHAPLAWHEEDLRGLSAQAQSERFEAYRMADKQAGFDFERAPLMRVALFRLDEARWRLLWTQHHILLDGWCLPLVYRDVMRLYYASMEGREAALPAPVPYERYIGWLQSREEAQARAHWRAVLGDVEAPTPLAIDRLGGDGEGYREQVLVLGAGATQALQALAKSRHTTVNTLVQWAWGYVLHRYSGEGSVVFGATISGRTAPVAGIEEMVGLFINTIPVRVDYAASEPLEAGIARLHREFQQGNEHGYLSLPEIQRQSGVAPGTALFDSILAFENYPLDAMSDLGSVDESTRIRMEATGNDEQTNYALTLNVMLGEALEVKAGFRAERLAAAAVGQVLRHLGRVLEQLPAAVGEGARIDLVDEDEAGGLLAQGRVRRHHRDLPRVHERFQAQARAHPDAIALAHGDERMSYGELNRRANRVAHRLRRSGVGADDRVGLCVERGFEMLIGVIGILKAGAGYVPLDPAYPAERLAFMLQDCRPKAVLTQAGLLASGVLPDTGATEIVSLDDASLAGEADTDPADVRVDDASLAYVIYTSGSTGKPKGVMVEHRQLNRLFASTRETFGFDHEDVWTLFHSFAFDFSVWEMWGALLHGGRLVIVPAPLARDPEGMWGLLEREGVTVLNQTPSAFRALQAAQPPDTSHRLRAVVFGGEALELSSLLPWFERNGDATRMVNMYGITETTVHVTCREIDMEDARRARGSLIGQPLDDLALYVLDESMRPCPLGVRGELYVGGDGVARGYLDREALTAERFVEATSFEGGRLYRTGDLARWLPGGELEYLGRNDFQVKIRGYRIELGEVEARLAACEGVRESVVLALDDPSGGKRLVAYVVMDGVDGRGVASLREAMSRDLAAHMLPSAFVELQAMPLTPNGKLDRKALPAPDRGAAASREYEAPADEVEQAVADAWQALLGVERVGRHDNFFELGGHSLLAVRMLGDLRTRFGMEMDIRDVFEKTTVSALAAYIAERRSLVALKDALAFDVVDQDEEFTEL